jgi:hypothetical protein
MLALRGREPDKGPARGTSALDSGITSPPLAVAWPRSGPAALDIPVPTPVVSFE